MDYIKAYISKYCRIYKNNIFNKDFSNLIKAFFVKLF